MKITENSVVSIAYVMTREDGEVLDIVSEAEPLRYYHGAGNIVVGLERALAGHEPGDAFDVVVPPEEGYGHRDGEPQAVPKSIFPPRTEFKIGAAMMAKSTDGRPFPLWIVSVGEDEIFVDGNHPLSGHTLCFSVKIVAVREATPDEKLSRSVHNGCELCRE